MLLKKFLSTAALTVTAAALTLGATSGASYAGSDDADERSGRGSSHAAPSASPTTSDSPSSDTPTATIRVKQQNVVITALTVSETGTSTLTVEDRKHSPRTVTWDVPAGVKMSGHYKKLSDLRVGYTIHIAGSRTGDAAPTADHIVAPGRNKKVQLQQVTITAVNGSAATITVRDNKGRTSTWSVRSAKVAGKTKRKSDLSAGDVVSLRGERVEGSSKGTASAVRVEKDVKAAGKKSKSSRN